MPRRLAAVAAALVCVLTAAPVGAQQAGPTPEEEYRAMERFRDRTRAHDTEVRETMRLRDENRRLQADAKADLRFERAKILNRLRQDQVSAPGQGVVVDPTPSERELATAHARYRERAQKIEAWLEQRRRALEQMRLESGLRTGTAVRPAPLSSSNARNAGPPPGAQ